MTRPGLDAARAVLAAFGLPPDARLEPVTSGHINESWRVRAPGDEVLLQWLNHEVFTATDAVQDNVERVLDQLVARAPGLAVATLRCAPDGARRVRSASGLWRAFDYLPGAVVHERPLDAAMAHAAGVALGSVLHGLVGLSPACIEPVLPGFHDLDVRLAAFDAALGAADAGRKADAAEVLARLLALRAGRSACAPTGAPVRVLHGDPKFTNFLFPVAGSGPVTLIDWDTVMAGPLAWDFGDFLRSAACSGREDAPAEARVEPERLRAAASGFLEGLCEPLPGAERDALVQAPAHMAFMLAVRFLTDHLAGDRYFRVHRPGQNLDRARAQLALAEAFEGCEAVLRSVVDDVLRKE